VRPGDEGRGAKNRGEKTACEAARKKKEKTVTLNPAESAADHRATIQKEENPYLSRHSLYNILAFGDDFVVSLSQGAQLFRLAI
jgi:hypothetical protein